MQILFDNLAATIISVIVLLILMAGYQRSQQVSYQAIAQEALWKQQSNFVKHVLRRDMAGVTWVTEFDADLEAGNPYVFYTRHESNADSVEVTYVPRMVKVLPRDTLYQIERYVKKPGQSKKRDGGSVGTITGWSIQGLNRDGEETSDLTAVQQFKVEMKAVAPFAVDGVRADQHWETTYRPVQLQGKKIL